MAIDPVENIVVEERETPFSVNLRQRVRELAHLKANTSTPYVSAYLDWRPDGGSPGYRPGTTILENEFSARLRELRDAGVDTAAVEADFERIRLFTRDTIDPAVHGIFILTNAATDTFEVVQIAMPVDTRVKVGPTPALRGLANVAEDYPPFLVVHADQYDAALFVVSRASLQVETFVESSRDPVSERQGPWSYRRYRNRLDERTQHFARAVADEVRRKMSELNIEMLVLSTSEVFTPVLQEQLHREIQERIVGRLHLPNAAPEHEIVNAAQELARQAERDREAVEMGRLNDALGTGQRAASGPSDVLRSLSSGQVATLLIARTYQATGWADHALGLYGIGDLPAVHPANGQLSSIVQVDVGEEMVRLALVTGADVEILPTATAGLLDPHGGVAALLRY